MAMTGSDLWAARKAAMDAVLAGYTQGADPGAAAALREALGLADSQAIVLYIQNNARATGNDSRGDTHSLTIT